MSNFKIIFVAGTHGVGKGYFCSEVANNFGLPVFSASKLIKETKQAEIDINKKVIDAEINQNLLISALKKIKTASKLIVLDGHFCLYSDKGIINVPIKTFIQMPLKSILVLYDFPENIYKRTIDRDTVSLSIDIISDLQERELEQANLIANLVGIPCYKIPFCDISKAIKEGIFL